MVSLSPSEREILGIRNPNDGKYFDEENKGMVAAAAILEGIFVLTVWVNLS